jgi:hypothetical protein
MTEAQSRRVAKTFGALQIAILVLVVITALVHLRLGITLGGFGGGAPRGAPPPTGAVRPPGGPPAGFNMFRYLPLPLSRLFLINSIGYLVLGAALYLPALARYRRVVRWMLIVYAATTFVLYFVFNGFRTNLLGYADKTLELTLIVLLLIDDRRSRRAEMADATPAGRELADPSAPPGTEGAH